MIREFSEEKREELYNILDAIYSYTSAPFLTWCRGCDFGDWFEKLHIKSYTDKIVSYETSFSDINSRMRTQINNIFENIEKTDQTFSAMLEEIAGKVKEQLEHIQILQQVMNTANGGSGGLYTDENVSLSYAIDMWIENSDAIDIQFLSLDKEYVTAIRLLDTQLQKQLGIVDVDKRIEILQNIVDNNPDILFDLYTLNIHSGSDYQHLMHKILFDIEQENRFLTDDGLIFLYECELGSKEGWINSDFIQLDENGKIVKIKIQDVGDGGYTLGFGIYISEDDQDRIALAESLGIKWNDLNYWVDIEDVNIMFSHVSPYYHNVEKGIERSTQKILTPQQYDAIFSLIYLRPKFQEKIIELINSNADKETWKKDLLYELESLPDYQRYPGWVDRIERTVDLYFDGIY